MTVLRDSHFLLMSAVFKPLELLVLINISMSYLQFLESHPELNGLTEDIKRESYAMYLEQLDESLAQLED